MRVYCIEDDPGIRDLTVYTLKSSGFTAVGCPDGKAFWAELERQPLPDLIILDVMLPGEDGVSILTKLRARADTRSIPVIMATARGAEYDKVQALDAGADDYVVKPYGMMELISRVRAVLRRAKPAAGAVLTWGDITLDTAAHRVSVEGKPVTLTRKEFELLQCLMSNPGRVLTRDTLLSDLWGYDFDGETRTVDVHIRTLRQKLGPAGAAIETVRGVGYRLEVRKP